MKYLITGGFGFTATHLSKHLASRPDAEITLAGRQLKDGVAGEVCDFTDPQATRDLLEKVAPDRIYHFAGTFRNDFEIDYPANVVTAKNVLDCVRDLNLNTRILLVGSAAEYGRVTPEDNPIAETHPLAPISNYGLTKVFQTELAAYYHRTHGVHVVLARTFNLFGQGLSPRLFAGRVRQQIEALQKGEIDRIKVGNLEGRRDYVDVSDAVIDYERILEHGKPGGVYNVGTGVGTRTGDILQRILEEAGLDMSCVDAPPPAPPDPRDVPSIYADIRKLQELRSIDE